MKHIHAEILADGEIITNMGCCYSNPTEGRDSTDDAKVYLRARMRHDMHRNINAATGDIEKLATEIDYMRAIGQFLDTDAGMVTANGIEYSYRVVTVDECEDEL